MRLPLSFLLSGRAVSATARARGDDDDARLGELEKSESNRFCARELEQMSCGAIFCLGLWVCTEKNLLLNFTFFIIKFSIFRVVRGYTRHVGFLLFK